MTVQAELGAVATARALTPDEAFERDIPPELRDTVLEQLSEALSCSKNPHADTITVLERERHDAINVRGECLVKVLGREFTVQLRDGNRDGTVLEAWEETGPQSFEPCPPSEWALQPLASVVAQAIAQGRAGFLVMKWDALLERQDIKDIARKYAYDRMMQPGIVVQRYWREQAARHGFELVTREEEQATRRRLTQAQAQAAPQTI